MKTSPNKKEYNRVWHLTRHLKDPRHRLFKNSRTRARMHRLEFSISLDDIVIPEYCPYLGLKLDPTSERHAAPSVDRVDNTKGYIKGNIQVISAKANRMKTDATNEELIKFAQSILAKENS